MQTVALEIPIDNKGANISGTNPPVELTTLISLSKATPTAFEFPRASQTSFCHPYCRIKRSRLLPTISTKTLTRAKLYTTALRH